MVRIAQEDQISRMRFQGWTKGLRSICFGGEDLKKGLMSLTELRK